jgi:hypothetical protein
LPPLRGRLSYRLELRAKRKLAGKAFSAAAEIFPAGCNFSSSGSVVIATELLPEGKTIVDDVVVLRMGRRGGNSAEEGQSGKGRAENFGHFFISMIVVVVCGKLKI